MFGLKKRLGDLLVDAGKLTKDQLKDVLSKQRSTGKKLGELLIDDGILTENDIIEVLKMQLDIDRVYLDITELDKNAVASIPENLAVKYGLIAIGYDNQKIKIAMSDPLNIFAIDDARIASGYEVMPYIATNDEINRAIDKYYSTRVVEQMAKELNKESNSKKEKEKEKEKSEKIETLNLDDVKNAPVVKLVDSIFSNAVKSRTSDIHIEPYETYLRIRYRVDGTLQEVLRLNKDSMAALLTRIKIMANLDIAEKRVPQDGRIITEVDGSLVDLRISVLPTVHGEKIVARILKRDSFLVGKEQLGMDANDLEKMDRILKSPYGIILVTGPTGSGKSTTLYAALKEINSPDTNVITVEDPVEYMMEGINQVNVNVKSGLTFAAGLRSILRQDPDVIMIGEIRDTETAQIAVRAAITGHLVLSTIHTNDAASAVVRLTDMGVEPYLAATAISGIAAQRLIRKICPMCKKSYEASLYEKNVLGVDSNEKVTLHKGTGCAGCNGSGYLGRQGIYEIMEITHEHRELIQNNSNTEEIRRLNETLGLKTLTTACKTKVLQGETTIDEFIKNAFLKE
jgi:type IV pilus assembly protein PilB